MKSSRSVCVFCGSSPSVDPVYFDLARAVGRGLAARGITLVYGGARVGTMGAVADAAMEAGGAVVGVIPRRLMERELAHTGVTELCVVERMDERKALMLARSDAFVALPGGFGTLDELFEVATLVQIGELAKPVALMDHQGFWEGLHTWIDRACRERFVPENVRSLIARCDGVDATLAWVDGALA